MSIVVTNAETLRPERLPMSTMVRASVFASSSPFMNAPLPVLTSSTMFFAPAASFLLITDAAIKGMLSTVAVTSRNA